MMKMNYFVLGTNDINAATVFYDSLFKDEGLKKVAPTERMIYWLGRDFAFAVAKPYDEQSATYGNGTMLGFGLKNGEEVTKLYMRALELGGKSEGGPAQRGPKFSAYVRDLDNNKLCFSD